VRAAFRPLVQIADYAHLVALHIPREALHPRYRPWGAWPAHELAHFVLVGRDRRRQPMMGLLGADEIESAAQECAANEIAQHLLCAAYRYVFSSFQRWRLDDECTAGDGSPWHVVIAHQEAITQEMQAVVREVSVLRSDPRVVSRVHELLQATPWRPWWGLSEWRAECAL
jgi:hypothetical protein